ncbi:glycosyltransferase family 4 protein [Streptomyces sp. SL13]|uniref:Glycosyltransferase family 4 protein n=1 Tax=Streptantibioticus silvisoli TaxID=2705255 RepID=A0AA90H688_9ACTN|nr:glycosyltransferase family 4 protein [Streptantibioticus silvisoli]MDI5971680.1 glycosyltransferase family 4 protein [Streptantibioticus silvisoli]
MTSTLTPRGPLRAVQVLGANGAGHVSSLSGGLVARGVDVTVCGPSSAAQSHGFPRTGVRFTAVEIPERPAPRDEAMAVAALRAACHGADVVHAHGLHAAMLASLALAGGAGGPALVVTWHAGLPVRGTRAGLLRLLERRVARAATVVLGAWSGIVDEVRGLGARDARLAPVSFPPERARVRPAGPQADKTRAGLGALDGPLILSVGRLEPHKGHDLLLDAAREWGGLRPRPTVVVAGEGADRAALQGRVDAEDLPVRLLGHRDDVPELLAAADLVVLPSRFESYPLIVHEAMRAGVPLVATAVGAVPELVGDAAVLVPKDDPEALAQAVSCLLADPALRARLSAEGRVQAATWPTQDDTIAQILSVYDELTHAPARS